MSPEVSAALAGGLLGMYAVVRLWRLAKELVG
jgi:hypothetical protein